MEIASWTGDLEGLTPLIIAVLLFGAAMIFRREIKLVLSRLARVNLKRGKTHIEADLGQHRDDEHDAPAESNVAEADPASASEEDEDVIAASDPVDASDVTVLRNQMMRAYISGDKATGDAKYSELTRLETDVGESKKDRVRKCAAEVVGGLDSAGIESLREMARDEEHAGFVYRMMGLSLNAIERPEEAAEAYLEAQRAAESPREAASASQSRAEILATLGRTDQAESELTERLVGAVDEEAISTYWSALAKVFEHGDKLESRALALHEVARARGNDAEAWFQAGYAYSNVESDHLTILVIHCYLNVLYFDREHRWALNNLGVVLNGADMPLLAVDRYMQAAGLGNTLAMANIADKLMRAGFQESAEEWLKKGAEAERPHENVASNKAALDSRLKAQGQKYSDLTAAGTRAGQFMTDYARRRLDLVPDIVREWKVDAFDATVETSESSKITISWEAKTHEGHRRFTGTLTGSTLLGSFEKETSAPWRDEMTWSADGTGYGILDDGGTTLRFLKLAADKAEYLDFSANASTSTLG